MRILLVRAKIYMLQANWKQIPVNLLAKASGKNTLNIIFHKLSVSAHG